VNAGALRELGLVRRGLPHLVGPATPVALVVLAVWGYWAVADGGVLPGGWGAGGTLLAALLTIALIADGRERLGRARVATLVALAAFVVWNFASISWAEVSSEAWIGSDRTLAYAISFAAFAAWRWRPTAPLAIGGMYALVVTGIGLHTLLAAAASSDPAASLQDGRLLPPIGYVNANAALWMSGLWPALLIGCARRVPLLLRAVSLAAAVVLVELAILGQSRGWFYLTIPLLALLVLLARQRLRVLLGVAIVGLVAWEAFDRLNQVFLRGDRNRPYGDTVHDAAVAVGISAAIVFACGAAWAALDRRFVLPRRAHLAAAAAVASVAVVAAAAGGAVAATRIDSPDRWVKARWADFTRGYPEGRPDVRFLGSIGSDRYQQWKVAWDAFVRHPIRGIGSDNYQATYLRERADALVEPRYPHSTELRLLSQLGIVGTLLFLAFLVPAVALLLRARRRLPAVEASGVVACGMVFAGWLAYGSIDWFWEIPALAAPAFGFLALGGSVGANGVSAAPEPLRLGRRAAGAIAVAGVVAVAALGLPWLAARYEEAGVSVWPTKPERAYAWLERSASLNPLSADPLVLEGSIALRRHDYPKAAEALRRALDRDPSNWYANLQLAIVYATTGRGGDARTYARRAHRLNPREPIVGSVVSTIEKGRVPDAARVNAAFLREVNRRLLGNPKL
jgi:hypothetical protein